MSEPFAVHSGDFTFEEFPGDYSWSIHSDGDLTVERGDGYIVAGFARGMWVKVVPLPERGAA